MATLLTTGATTVTAGETPDLTSELHDTDGSALTKSQITSLTITMKDCGGNVINSRDAIDINDTGIGTLVDGATTVTLTVKPTTSDTAYQGASGTVESHYWEIKWGWTDSGGTDRIGGEIYELLVERLPSVTSESVGAL